MAGQYARGSHPAPWIRWPYDTPWATHRRSQVVHRLRWLVGQVVERLGGCPDRVHGHLARFQRKPAEPPDGGSLVAVRIAVAQHQADPERIAERDAWQLSGGRQDQDFVARVKRATKSQPGFAHANICSQRSQGTPKAPTFAPYRTRCPVVRRGYNRRVPP